MTNRNAEPLLPVELGAGKVKFAQGIKAGRCAAINGIVRREIPDARRKGLGIDLLELGHQRPGNVNCSVSAGKGY